MQYFITYVLGLPRKANKKAELGTIVHKVLEILAIAKLEWDTTSSPMVTVKEPSGVYEIDTTTWLKPFYHTAESALAINTTRLNKDKYRSECKIPDNQIHYGRDFIENLTERVFNYYKAKGEFEFENIDLKDVKNWVWMALEHQNGAYDPRRRKIVCPEKSFDIEIKRKWAKYNYKLGDETIKGNLAIKGTIDLVTDVGDGIYEIVDWKGLPTDTSIPTPEGWTTMGELKIGDIIFDKDGRQTRVLAKSQKSCKSCYEITFDDTTKVECDNEHLWLLDNNTVVPITELKVGDKIDVTKPLDIEDVELPIDPYVLGVWLGDGRNRSADITSGDSFIFDEIIRRGYILGKDTEKKQHLHARTILKTTGKLRQLNLLRNKHIPNIYLRASFKQRLDLLRGLMDTDGNANSVRKQAVFTTCNKNLSDNVKELLLSLGQRVNQGEINRDTNFKSNVNIFPLHFRPININPFLLPRKANQIDVNWGPGQSNKRRIENIRLLPNQLETQCISVDSPTKTYLCTENMIPTHNTGQRKNWATGEVKEYDDLKKDQQLMLYYYAARHVFPEAKSIIITIFFIRDGGTFTLCFDDDTLLAVEKNLQSKMIEISSCTSPKMLDPRQKDFMCNKLCDFYKNKMDGTNVCLAVGNKIKLLGIDRATEELKDPNFKFDKYQAPGGE